MCHPLRHTGEIERVNAPEDSSELEDIWVGQRVPENNLFAKSLNETSSMAVAEKANS